MEYRVKNPSFYSFSGLKVTVNLATDGKPSFPSFTDLVLTNSCFPKRKSHF